MARQKSRSAPSETAPEQVSESFIIDSEKGWIFNDENSVVRHFQNVLDKLNQEFAGLHQADDFDLSSFQKPEVHLKETLLNPDQIWKDEETTSEYPLYIYFKTFRRKSIDYSYVVISYVSDNRPTFILTHFPSQIPEMVETYRRTELVFDKDSQNLEFVDALASQDPLAIGLFQAMLKLRSSFDFPVEDMNQERFQNCRVETLDNPDEIWRLESPQGPAIVKFIKKLKFDEESFWYLVITAEESTSGSHYVLFSFPSRDTHLVERYRFGEKLEADEFIREESH